MFWGGEVTKRSTLQTDTRLGTFEDVVRACKLPIAAIARTLRHLIGDVLPDVVEAPRPAEQHVRYALRADKMNETFGYICPMQDYVRLRFYNGGGLPDPRQLLEGTGKRLRHIKIYSLPEAGRPKVRRIVRAAVQERKKAPGLK